MQGVGFRWWVRSRALELGLVGFAENLADGRVKVVAEGASGGCQDLLALLADGTASADAARSGGLDWSSRSRRPGRVSQSGAPVGRRGWRYVRLHGAMIIECGAANDFASSLDGYKALLSGIFQAEKGLFRTLSRAANGPVTRLSR